MDEKDGNSVCEEKSLVRFWKETPLLVNRVFHSFENIAIDEAERHFCYYVSTYEWFIRFLNEL